MGLMPYKGSGCRKHLHESLLVTDRVEFVSSFVSSHLVSSPFEGFINYLYYKSKSSHRVSKHNTNFSDFV